MVVKPRGEAVLGPAALARWLAWPLAFVASSWCMLLYPAVVKDWAPALWTTGGKGVEEVLPPQPKTRVQTFDLGGHAMFYADHCTGGDVGEQCEVTLRSAAEIVGWNTPLSPKQLLGMRELLAELDAQKSTSDRVMGLLNFINIMWLVAVLGIVATVGPCLAYLLGPIFLKCGRVLVRQVLVPVTTFLHQYGFLEAAAYLVSFTVAAQGLRYPAAQAHAGMMVGFTGGLFMIPCWAYSTALHVKQGGGDENKFIMLSSLLIAAILAPLAITHDSRLIGFFAVLSLYSAMGFMCAAFGFGFRIGFDNKQAMHRCLAASVFLIFLFVSLRLAGVAPQWLRPFATGAMCLGNIMYFLAMLILSGCFHPGNYLMHNGIMLASLVAALLVGSVYALPSMSNTACVFLVLWGMEKEFEIQWGGLSIVALFANFVGMYFAAHYLNTHPELITSMFDPEGLYVT